jgi:5'-3' exonuclease
MQSLKLQLIDINGLGFAAMYQPNLAKLSHNGESTSALHGAIASVLSQCELHKDYIPVVLWDGHAKFRYDVHPEYKGNRADKPEKVAIRESYKKQTPIIRLMLQALGIPQISSRDYEADDLAGWICSLVGDDVEVLMNTKDSDWWQFLRPGVTWYSPFSEIRLTHEDLLTEKMEKFDGPFTIEQYVMAKAMAGDSSDNITGVPKVGLKTAVKLLNEHGSFEAMWARHDAGETIKGVVAGAVAGPEYRATYLRNLKLIDHRQAPPLPDHAALLCQDKDLGMFKAICEEYGLKRMGAQGERLLLDLEQRARVVSHLSHILDSCHQHDRCWLREPEEALAA